MLAGNPVFEMLDLKLASYIPFITQMRPGIFHAASDTIEVYNMGESDWNREDTTSGFTALAHPSTIEIGRTHGVFVLKRAPPEDSLMTLADCLQVLQKPSRHVMTQHNAVVNSSTRGDFVYTDSCFYFDHSVSQKFLQFYDKYAPLKCEIDSYGDFLQALGPNATSDYVNDIKNVSHVEENLVETRGRIYDLLRGERLSVLVLNSSKFYHFGTMTEYIENFCQDTDLVTALQFQCMSMSKCSGEKADGYEETSKPTPALQGRIIHSMLHDGTVASTAVLEYCQFDVPVTVQARSLINSCSYLRGSGDDQRHFKLPPNLFMHSIALQQQQFTTVCVSVDDDVKKSVREISALSNLRWFGRPLDTQLRRLGWSTESVFPNSNKMCLWNARLFPTLSSPSQSFESTFRLVNTLCGEKHLAGVDEFSGYHRVSLLEATSKLYDVQSILSYRRELHDRIIARRN